MVDNKENLDEKIINESENKTEKETAKEEKGKKISKREFDELKEENRRLKEEIEESNNKYLRMIAEYDNFRKRSLKEREGLYADAYCDAVKEMLPLIDNLERAKQFLKEDDNLSAGVSLTLTQLDEILVKMGVEVIDPEGGKFDPSFHNAVMHSEDDKFDENTIAQVFSKGYKKGDKIIRYAMVQVVN